MTWEVESIDRLYLHVYLPRLQIVAGVLGFLKERRGQKVASPTRVAPRSRRFVAAIHRLVQRRGIPLIHWEKGPRKEDVAARLPAPFPQPEGVLFVGPPRGLSNARSSTATGRRARPMPGS